MKLGQNFAAQVRETFVQAALTEDGASRVDSSSVREAITKAVTESDLSLRSFKSGSVGVQVVLKGITVTNDAGEEFDLRGQILLTIPETVPAK